MCPQSGARLATGRATSMYRPGTNSRVGVATATLWLAVIATAWPVYAQGRGGGAFGAGPGAGQAPTGTSIIIGRVVEGTGTTPVSGAVVRLTGAALGRGGSAFAA